MSRKKNIILLFCIFIGLLALFAIIQKKDASSDSNSETNATEKVVNFTEDMIEKIIITEGDVSLTFLPIEVEIPPEEAPSETSGEDASLDTNTEETPKKTIEWTLEGKGEMDLNTASIKQIATKSLLMDSSHTVSLTEDLTLESFGLTTPQKSVTYTLKDGTTTTLSFGITSVDGDSVYVMKDNDDTTLYMINALTADSLTSDLSYYRTKTLDTIDRNAVIELKASGKDMPIFHLKQNDGTVGFSTSQFVLLSPTSSPIPLSTEATTTLFDSIPSFYVDAFIEDSPSDLSPYGLDAPTLDLELTTQTLDGENTITHSYHYLFGDFTEDGTIYFMKEGIDSVFSMDGAIIKKLMEQLDTFALSEKLVTLTDIATIDQVDVITAEDTYTLSIEREIATETAEDGTETKVEKETYFAGDILVNEELFKSVYQFIIGIKADTKLSVEGLPSDTRPAFTIRYTLKDGTVKNHDFYPYDNQFYLYKVDDTLYVGCNIKQFDYLKKELHSLIEE